VKRSDRMLVNFPHYEMIWRNASSWEARFKFSFIEPRTFILELVKIQFCKILLQEYESIKFVFISLKIMDDDYVHLSIQGLCSAVYFFLSTFTIIKRLGDSEETKPSQINQILFSER
jgi:hypothetical protein